VLGFLAFVVGVLVVGGLLFLGASWLLGRGETQPPADLDRSPVELPDDRPVTADDVRALQISVAFRGYRMTEVDWLLDQVARALEDRDARYAAEIAALRESVHAHPVDPGAPKDSQSHTAPDVAGDPDDEERTDA
jgi:DivIVA domain-containing protein